jgi:CDP-diacylglycerol--serine O-phosphatidyltransferase
MMFSPFEPERKPGQRRRFRAIPVRTLLPNVITVLALCAGLTAIRLATEQKFEWALYAIVFAALLDGIDGRVARMLKGTSRFGAELDSLADFVNFGVAPALILYMWGLNEFKSLGWIAALVFALCAALRLARFNVTADDPHRPAWADNFFQGIPAPAGAITVLLPLYVELWFPKLPHYVLVMPFAFFYTLAIALLMVSRLPVFSGKRVGKRVPPDLVRWLFVGIVLFFGVLIAYPWETLTIGSLGYIISLPRGLKSYREHERKAREGAPADAVPESEQSPALAPTVPTVEDPERPTRLN